MSSNLSRPPLTPLLPLVGDSRAPPGLPALLAPPKKRVLACETCRIKKTRCDGARPACGKCVQRALQCEYVDTEFRHVKRKYENLRNRATPLEELFEMLRTMPDSESHEVLRRIKTGMSPEEILRLIQDGDLLMQLWVAPEGRRRYDFPFMREMPAYLLTPTNPYLETQIFEYPLSRNASHANLVNARSSVYLTPFHAAEIIEPSIDSSEPSHWTSICSDNTLMRKLLKRYFLTEYHTCPFFQKDIFLDDLNASRRQNCSPLLVNSVLALACYCNPKDSRRSEFWNPNSLAYRFLAEARRLWEAEARLPNLPTVQATLMLSVLANMNGDDQTSCAYIKQAVDMAAGLQMFDPPSQLTQRADNARIFTVWMLYAWQGLAAFMQAVKPLCDSPPRSPLPDVTQNPHWYGEISFKYSSVSNVYATHFGHLFLAKVKLWSIANDIANHSYKSVGSDISLSAGRVSGLYLQLQQWYDGLPECLQPNHVVTPYGLQLHMQYHNYIINILEEPVATELRSPIYETPKAFRKPPEDILEESRRSFETLIRIYYLRHGFEALDCFIVQVLAVLALMTQSRIAQGTNNLPIEVLQSSLVLAVVGLADQSHSFYTSQMVLGAVRNCMAQREIELIGRFVQQGRAKEAHPPQGLHAEYTWPINFSSITADREARRLGRLFKGSSSEKSTP